MIKRLTILFTTFVTVIFSIIIYLSIFGINTKYFNNKIKSQILNINKKVNLELKNVKFKLNPLDLSINIKTIEPKIFINNSKLELESLKTNVSLQSFFNKEFSIDDLQISTKTIKLNDLIFLARSFKKTPELFLLDSVIKEGFLVGDININFDNNGKIKDDYEIKGFIKKGKLDFLRSYSIDNLSLIFNVNNEEYYLKEVKGFFNQIKLTAPIIKIKDKKNQFLINGKLINKKNDINFDLIRNLLGSNFKDNNIESIKFASINDFTFELNKKLKISDFKIKSTIDLDNLVYKKNLPSIKKYLPEFKDIIILKNHQISIDYSKDEVDIKGKGDIFIDDKIDKVSYELRKKNNDYNFNTIININKNLLLLDAFNYKKDKNLNSNISLAGSYNKQKKTKFDNISLIDDNKNYFIIENLDLNDQFKINNIKKLDVEFINNNNVKNKFSLKNNKKNYKVYGSSFDASKLIDEILEDNNNKESKSIFNNLNSKINIDIDKIYFDKDTYVNNLSGSIFYKNNKINKLNLNSIFPNKKKLTLSINTNNNNEIITTLYSDYPKPLIKRYQFVKGFEEGVLDFSSIKKGDVSNSLLIIDNFKVQEVPVLAKLLTLASLQGIADLLTGEGIRFTDLEMKFSNKKGLMTIEEMYAIGPAISILMEGYIESQKLISLRGTLVPATTINRSIASIPLVGRILVGKKTGEGIFGVSFKVKGPPKNLKTTVNPVKTLTPRFITRTLEKIKKN